MLADNLYSLFYSLALCLVCSILLTLASTRLKPLQELNVEVDRQYNVLKAARLVDPARKPGNEEIRDLYRARLEELKIKDAAGAEFPLFRSLDETRRTTGYILPVSGKGLWSTLFGYLALEPDGATVKGITFYQHGETPGLGAEIEAAWFTDNFVGKKIYDRAGALVGIRVAKGKAKDAVKPDELEHAVDGISGSTLTGNGVTRLILAGLRKYEPFLKARAAAGEAPAGGAQGDGK